MMSRRDFGLAAVAGIGGLALSSPEAATAASAPKMTLTVVYPNHDGARFDMDYYRFDHIPHAMKVMKADSVMLIEGVPNGNTPAPYAMIAIFQFASNDGLQAALADPAMADLRTDLTRFTDIKPTVTLGRTR